MTYLKLSLFIALYTISNLTIAQELDLSEYDLKAHYELSSNGTDLTGNSDPIELENPEFSFDGVLSRGCKPIAPEFLDSCLIMTPQMNALNDLSFAIQVDFRLSSLGKPVIVAGNSFRFLGIETSSDGSLWVLINNSVEAEISNLNLQLDQWYNIALVHNTLDSLTQIFFDEELIFTKKIFLNHPEDDTNISNTNFSDVRAFFGYWKNLKVYSTNFTSSTIKIDGENSNIQVFPNPVNSILYVDLPHIQESNYEIFDIEGRSIAKSNLVNNSISTSNLIPGLYIIVVYTAKNLIGRTKFIKK